MGAQRFACKIERSETLVPGIGIDTFAPIRKPKFSDHAQRRVIDFLIDTKSQLGVIDRTKKAAYSGVIDLPNHVPK